MIGLSLPLSSTHQGFTMKFVALALTLLLAVGSQARALQADAPSQLEHYKAMAMVYLNQVRESAHQALDHLDGTDYEQYKQRLADSFDQMQEYAQQASLTLAPFGEAVVQQFMDATEQMRVNIMADVEDLRSKLEPHRSDLSSVLQKHIDDYRAELAPVLDDYVAKNREEFNALRSKLQPMIDGLRTKFESNWEETKGKMTPMVEILRSKITERLESLRSVVAPYASEYREQLAKAVEQMGERLGPHYRDAHTQLEPYLEDVKNNILSMWDTMSQMLKV